jgi:hypothetical protein
VYRDYFVRGREPRRRCAAHEPYYVPDADPSTEVPGFDDPPAAELDGNLAPVLPPPVPLEASPSGP